MDVDVQGRTAEREPHPESSNTRTTKMEKADIEIGESTVSHDLANFIIEHSEAARSLDESDWEKLDGTAWVHVLRSHPELADKCDWTALPLRMVAALLAEQPLAAEVAKKQRGFRGRYLSISFDGTSEATSFACMPDLAMKDPQSENRRVSIYKKDGQPNPWPDPVEFKPPKLVPYANLEPGYNTVLKVEEDGELLLKRRLAVAYLVGVKLLPPEFVFAGRDDQFFKEHAIEGADIEGFWVDYVQHHGRVKWTRWVLELPEGEHFDPGKLEIPVFTGYTVEEPDPDLDAEFFCDPKRIRYDGKHPDAESMQFRSDPKFDEDVLTGVEL